MDFIIFSKFINAWETRVVGGKHAIPDDDDQSVRLDKALRQLISKAALPLTTPEDQETALSFMKQLLDLGASPNSASKNGWRVVKYMAIWEEHASLLNIRGMQLLLDYQADVRNSVALCAAARKGREHMVEFLLRQGCDPYAVDADGYNALDNALLSHTFTGSVSIINLLLKCGVKQVAVSTLFQIVKYGRFPDGMRILLENGLVDVNCVDDDNGYTLLHAAVYNRHASLGMVLLLLEHHANPTFITKAGSTPFVLACGSGTVECAKALSLYVPENALKGKRVPRNHPDYLGMSRLYFRFGSQGITFDELIAALSEYPDDVYWAMLRLALPDLSADQRAKIRENVLKIDRMRLLRLIDSELSGDFRMGANKDTDLHLAVRKNSVTCIQYAMERHVNPFLLNKKGECALNYACTPAIRKMLDEYVLFNGNPHQMRWLGPYFRKRVVAFLLVVYRWKKERIREIPRDVRVCIFRWVARFESV